MRSHLVATLSACVLITGCASVDVQRVKTADQPGIRYWRPSLYVVLQKTKDTCDVKTLTLPDKTEEYAITFTPGMGTADVSPTLYEGWRLDALSAKLDSKTAENINAIANLLKNAAPGGLLVPTPAPDTTKKSAQPERPCSGMFKVLYDPAGEFAGFRRVL